MDQLAHIIDALDAQEGLALSAGDRAVLEAVLAAMLDDAELVQQARVNSRENFLLVFGAAFESEVIKAERGGRAFFERFFANEEFHDGVVRSTGAEFHRRHGSEPLAA